VSIIYSKADEEKRYGNNNDNDYDETIFVEADKERITQVLYNLLDNAVKFSKDNNGTVSVTSEKKKQGEEGANNNKGKGQQQQDEQVTEEDIVVVKVEDTGIGIHPEILPRLFTKFATRSLTGTGLGLYISKSIIEAHGGRIWAESDSHGNRGGATFAFSLPLA
jgi:signal transduction histidine kinase